MGCSGPFPVPPALGPAFKALAPRKAEGDQPQPGAAPLLRGRGRAGAPPWLTSVSATGRKGGPE